MLLAFVAVGIQFGLLYFLLYLTSIARHNTLVVEAWKHEWSRQKYAVFAFRTAADECQDALSSDRSYLAMSRAIREAEGSGAVSTEVFEVARRKQQLSAVIAQDKPVVQVKTAYPTRVERLFMASLQFRPGRADILPTDRLTFELDENQIFHPYLRPPPQSEGRESEKKAINWDNRKVLLAFSGLVETLRSQPAPSERAQIHVSVSGTADRRPYHGPGGNPGLASQRARAAADALISRLGDPKVDNWYVQELRHAIRMARNSRTTDVQQRVLRDLPWRLGEGTEPLELRWPAKESSESEPSYDHLAGWRVAAVEIRLEHRDPTASTEMTSDLASEATLADMLYFSFVSFTTTGYGDIKAVSRIARSFVIAENVLELVFTAILFTMAFQARSWRLRWRKVPLSR